MLDMPLIFFSVFTAGEEIVSRTGHLQGRPFPSSGSVFERFCFRLRGILWSSISWKVIFCYSPSYAQLLNACISSSVEDSGKELHVA